MGLIISRLLMKRIYLEGRNYLALTMRAHTLLIKCPSDVLRASLSSGGASFTTPLQCLIIGGPFKARGKMAFASSWQKRPKFQGFPLNNYHYGLLGHVPMAHIP